MLPRLTVRAPALLLAIGSLSAFGATAARADTTSVYFDSNNLLASPDPFLNGNHGLENTGTGRLVLQNLQTTTDFNTANGYTALQFDNTGTANSAFGRHALQQNRSGSLNSASGTNAMEQNFSGSSNVANGYQALLVNTAGSNNTAVGSSALQSNKASNNVALGFQTLFANSTGNLNTGFGLQSLFANTTGSSNTGLGSSSLKHVSTGSSNIGLGTNAGTNLTTGSNDIDVANAGVKGESGIIRIGTTGTHTQAFLAGVSGVVPPGQYQPVVINSLGQLGTENAAFAARQLRTRAAQPDLTGLVAAMGRQQRAIRRQQRQLAGLGAQVRALRRQLAAQR